MPSPLQCALALCPMIHRDAGATEGAFCGTSVPGPFGPSSGNQLSVHMKTDKDVEKRGFRAEWKTACDAAGSG